MFDSAGCSALIDPPRYYESRFSHSQNVLKATVFHLPDHYTPDFELLVPNQLQDDCSLRHGLLQQLQSSTFLDALAQDNSILLWALLRRIAVEWQDVIGSHELDITLSGHEDFVFAENNLQIQRYADATNRCQEHLRMLKASYAVLENAGTESLRCLPGTRAEALMKDLMIDLADLMERTENCISNYRHRLTLVAAVKSIHGSEKAIKQSNTIG